MDTRNLETTFTMIKPDVSNNTKIVSEIIDIILFNGYSIIDSKRIVLTREQAESFYSEHKGKPFFDNLVEFITSGEVLSMILMKDNAITDFRRLIGSTDPQMADPGSIRFLYAESKSRNAIHGSDSISAAKYEISTIFI